MPTGSSSSTRPSAVTRETFATESRSRPVERAGKRRLPGASASRRLPVRGTTITVATRLRFRAFPCTTTTGRRKPAPEPTGAGMFAQHTSPRTITSRSAGGSAERRHRRTRASRRRRRDPRHDSSPPSPHPAHAERDTPRGPQHTRRSGFDAPKVRTDPLAGTQRRGSIQPSSYCQYNRREPGGPLGSAPDAVAEIGRFARLHRASPLGEFFLPTLPKPAAAPEVLEDDLALAPFQQQLRETHLRPERTEDR